MKKNKILGVIVTLVLVVLYNSLDWLIACGIIKLVTLCFSLKFSWLISTGIWLIVRLLHAYLTK